MSEIIRKPAEIQLICIERTSLIPVENPKKQINRRDYQNLIRIAWSIAEIEFGIIIVLALTVWALQAGPI